MLSVYSGTLTTKPGPNVDVTRRVMRVVTGSNASVII